MIKNTWIPSHIEELSPSARALYEKSIAAKVQLDRSDIVIPEILSLRVRNILFRYQTKAANIDADGKFNDDLRPFVKMNSIGKHELDKDSIRKSVEDGSIWNVPGLASQSIAEICRWLESL